MSRTRAGEEPLLGDPAVVESFKKKLALQLTKHGWNNADLARKLNVSGTAVGKWLRTGIIGKNNLMALCQAFGKSPSYFMNPGIPADDTSPAATVISSSVSDDVVQLCDYSIAHAGAWETSGDAPPILSMMVRKCWLFAKISSDSVLSELFIYTIQNDTMSPTLNPGDMVLVDRSTTRPTKSGFYLVSISGELGIRRLQLTPEATVIVSCDNDAYTGFTVDQTSHDSDNFALLARVVSPLVIRSL